MTSASRGYERDGRYYRYRYRAITKLGAGQRSKAYVELGACRRLVDKIKPTWGTAEVMRVRQWLAGPAWERPDPDVLAEEFEVMRGGRWIPMPPDVNLRERDDDNEGEEG